MSRIAMLAVAASSLALVTMAGPSRAYEGRETSSKEVSLEQVPEPARKTLLEQAGQNRIRELEEKVVDGETVYEIELLVGGKETEVVVAPDGRLVRVKTEGEAQVVAAAPGDDAGWRRNFDVDKKRLGIAGQNPYFPLTPGRKVHLTDGSETVVVSVLDETKVVDGVQTRVVEEHESEDGKLVEISRNYFAIDSATGDVYYFGEDVDVYEDGKVVSHEGAWLAGKSGAKLGLIMPGKPTVGDRFYLEDASGAVERVEIVKIDAALETPLRSFEGLVHAREHDVVDGDSSDKWYAAGIGMIGDDAMRVVKIEEPAP